MEIKRIMLVEDEESVRLTLAANLELDGFEVIEAESAEVALELLSSNAVDAVLSDIRMPGINGVEMFREIRRKHAELPVILMTAFTTEEFVDQAIDEGVFTVLSKPVNLSKLAGTLERAIDTPFILVVDDTEQAAQEISAGLTNLGMRTRSASDAKGALEAIRNGTVDVCVTRMVLDGPENENMIEKVRSLDPNVICIVVAKGDSAPDVINATRAGAYSCMKEPVRLRELLRNIAQGRAARASAG